VKENNRRSNKLKAAFADILIEYLLNLRKTSAQKRDEPEEKGPSRKKKTRLSYTKMIHLQKKGLINYIQ
jgi:hypothetical protein